MAELKAPSRIKTINSVLCLVSKIDDQFPLKPHPEEISYVQDTVQKRQREFHAGRKLARRALHEIAQIDPPILMDKNRLPVWPPGILGSISHTNEYVVVAVGYRRLIANLGIDIAEENSVDCDLRSEILSVAEISSDPQSTIDLTVSFSIKEAIFKSVFPVYLRYFEFTDIRIIRENTRFRAEICNPSLNHMETIVKQAGYIHRHENHIISLSIAPVS